MKCVINVQMAIKLFYCHLHIDHTFYVAYLILCYTIAVTTSLIPVLFPHGNKSHYTPASVQSANEEEDT